MQLRGRSVLVLLHCTLSLTTPCISASKRCSAVERQRQPNERFKWQFWFSPRSPTFKKHGGRIEYLPSDIKSLQTKLSYLLATSQAGNKSATRNKIIAIADNLLQRNSISRKKYRQIMHYL